jgi:hypothetical protein
LVNRTFETDDSNATPTGATVETTYLSRRQEVVGVNKNDLEDLVDFDASEISFGGVGMFFVSGSAWLFVEKYLENKDLFLLSPLFWVCLMAVAVGGFLLYQAFRMHRKKRSRIQRIFSETKDITDATPVAKTRAKTQAT